MRREPGEPLSVTPETNPSQLAPFPKFWNEFSGEGAGAAPTFVSFVALVFRVLRIPATGKTRDDRVKAARV